MFWGGIGFGLGFGVGQIWLRRWFIGCGYGWGDASYKVMVSWDMIFDNIVFIDEIEQVNRRVNVLHIGGKSGGMKLQIVLNVCVDVLR